MKEMIYQKPKKCEVLAEGEYKGYRYAIVSYGTHPAAYVENKNGFCNRDRANEIEKVPHGRFTYLDTAFWTEEEQEHNYLGWDYAHLCDYIGNYNLTNFLGMPLKKWTTEEIYAEVLRTIDELIKYPSIEE